MKIVVLLKQTFDTEEKIAITPGGVEERDAKLVINPYDEYALEEALRIRERLGGQVLVVACGPERAQEALRTALAIGADEAIRIDSSSLPDDSFAVAAALAAVVAPLQPDLLLAGLFAVDSGSGSVALQVAQRLGLPHASAAIKITLLSPADLAALPAAGDAASRPQPAERYALVERDVEGDTETVTLPLPALLTAQQGLNEPRYPSLPGIMKAKRKPMRIVARGELDSLSAASAASRGASWTLPAQPDGGAARGGQQAASPADLSLARTIRTQLLPPPARAAGKRLAGSPAEQAAQLAALLRSEAKLL